MILVYTSYTLVYNNYSYIIFLFDDIKLELFHQYYQISFSISTSSISSTSVFSKFVYFPDLGWQRLHTLHGQQWNIQPRDETINDLIEINEMRIEDWLQDQEKYPVLQTKFNMYLDKKENDSILDNIKEDIKLMMYNKRHTAISPLTIE